METNKPLTLCILLFGDYPDLANRCLESISRRLFSGTDIIHEIKLGLNQISLATQHIVYGFECSVDNHGIPLTEYRCPVNAYKYPLMRRMFHDAERPLSEWTMWFDDDSYFDFSPELNWWRHLQRRAEIDKVDMLGKIYWQAMIPSQWQWIRRQKWFNPDVGKPKPFPRFRNAPSYRFATGGWWTARSKIFTDNDWPTPELKLHGGDSMLGELCRHKGYNLVDFEFGVRINADAQGRHSKAPGRGGSLHPKDRPKEMLGNYTPEYGLHDFECQVIERRCK